MDAASKSVNVKLTIHERDANAFVKFITECMKEVGDSATLTLMLTCAEAGPSTRRPAG